MLLTGGSGLLNSALEVASVDALLTTDYGRLLLVKAGLALLMGLAGLVNGWLLRRPGGLARLPRALLAEAALAGVILILVGGLKSGLPPNGVAFRAAAAAQPSMLSQTVDDLLLTFQASPNQPGTNTVTLRAVSSRRPAPPVRQVVLRFIYLEQEMGEANVQADLLETNTYHAGGNFFTLPGLWQVQVSVRRVNLPEVKADFDWYVFPVGGLKAAVVSNQPLAPGLIPAGIVLLLAALGVGMRHLLRKR